MIFKLTSALLSWLAGNENYGVAIFHDVTHIDGNRAIFAPIKLDSSLCGGEYD